MRPRRFNTIRMARRPLSTAIMLLVLCSSRAWSADTSVIQALIDTASPGDSINIPAGTYTGNTLDINKSLVLVGQIDGNGDPTTIIDGEGTGELVRIHAYLDDGQWAADGGDHQVRFTNIILRNGNNWTEATDGPLETGAGGAISIRTIGSCQSPTAPPEHLLINLANCRVEDCWANQGGGGIANTDFSSSASGCDAGETHLPVRIDLGISECTFTGNGSTYGGDIALTWAGEIILGNSTFENGRGGGSLSISKGEDSCTLIRNVRLLDSLGTALTQYGGTLFVGNTVITGHKQGILAVNNCDVRVLHSTIADNIRDDMQAAGVMMSAGGGPTTLAIRNSILWGNTNINGMDEEAQYDHAHPSGTVDVDYSTIHGAFGAQNPLFTDPLGADGLAGGADADYRLLPGSPAVDAADSALTYLGWDWPASGLPIVSFQCRDGLDGVSNLYDGPMYTGGSGSSYAGVVWSDQGPLPCGIAQADDTDGTATAPDLVWWANGTTDNWSDADNWLWSDVPAGAGQGAILGPQPSTDPIIDGPRTVERLTVTQFPWSPTFNGELTITGDRGLRIGGSLDDLVGPTTLPALEISDGPAPRLIALGGGEIGLGGTLTVGPTAQVQLNDQFRLLDGGTLSIETGSDVNALGTIANHDGIIDPTGAATLSGGGTLELTGLRGASTYVSGKILLDLTEGDSLHVNGDVTLGGVIKIQVPKGHSIVAGDVFTLLSCSGSMSGPVVIEADLPGDGLMFRVRRSSTFRGGDALVAEAVEIGSYLSMQQAEDATTSTNINDAILADVDFDQSADTNGDGVGDTSLPDLVISASGTTEDAVHVLLNKGDVDGDDVWDGFDTQVTQVFPAGDTPMGLAVGNLSGQPVSETDLPEIAVALRHVPAIVFLNFTGGSLSEFDRILVECRDGTDATDGDCGDLGMPEPIDVVFWNLNPEGPDGIPGNGDDNTRQDIVVTCWGDSSYRTYETTETTANRGFAFERRTVTVVNTPPWGIDPTEDEDTKNNTARAMSTNPDPFQAELSVLDRGPLIDPFTLQVDTIPLADPGTDLPMAVGDLDNNGFGDLVVAQRDAGAIEIVLTDDNGEPTGAMTIPSPGSDPQSIALGDFDDDGDLDIAVIVLGTGGANETRLLRSDFIESGGSVVSFTDTGETFDTEGPPVRVLADNVDDVVGDSPADDAVILTTGTSLRGAITIVEPNIDGPIKVSTVQELEDAVSSAPDGGEIRIASGTYQLTDSIDITDRDIMISGPRPERGTPTVTLVAAPGDRVFRFNGGQSDATRLENLIIEGNDAGGGLLVQETSGDGPVIEDCIFQNCTFGYGAAIYLGNSDSTKEHKLTVRRCSFGLNEADSHSNEGVPQGDGGGIYAWHADLTVVDCAFVANSAVDDGGAILSRSSVVTLTESIFQMNNTPSAGGAIYAFAPDDETGSMVAENCIFGADDGQPMGGQLSNTCGVDGGAIYATSTGNSLLLIGCDFRDNDAARRGGAVIARDGASFAAYHSLFEANTTSGYGSTEVRGGAIYTYNCELFNLNNCDFFDNESQVGGAVRQGGSDPTDATITDCEFRGNRAMSSNGGAAYGGAMHLYQSTPCILTRCTIVDNEAGDFGGGLRVDTNTPVWLSDSIVCSNSPDQIFGTTTNVDGTWIAETCDLDGDGIPDNEDSWPYGPNPEIAGSLQQAVDNAADGDTITLAAGIYTASPGAAAVIEITGKEISIIGQLGPDGIPTTILDGEDVRKGITVDDVDGTGTPIFRNLLIQNCLGSYGGGCNIQFASPRFEQCWFADNTAVETGGAVHMGHTSASFIDCVFVRNHADRGGAVMASSECDPLFEGCSFGLSTDAASGNSADGSGGAMFLDYGLDSPPCVVTDCDFFSNYAATGGGAIRLYREDAILTGCRFGLEGSPTTGNTTSTPVYAGGAITANDGSLQLTDCQFHHNLSHYGGGVYVNDCHESLGHSVSIQSCRFTNNDAASGGGFVGHDSTITINDTDFEANNSIASNGAGGALYLRSWLDQELPSELTMTG
ncbi:MAG: right-handed parallel beta-helix repeat-containing protein, partial [Phycisphaerales bacterium]|nr:right-handed parallel beta-helix repeat-containing protein [Phycisphaerales bacterium]